MLGEAFRRSVFWLLLAVLCLNASAATEIYRAQKPSEGVTAWQLSPDEQWLVYYEESTASVYSVPVASPGQDVLLAEHAPYRVPYITPDSRYVAVIGYGDQSDIVRVVPIDGSSPERTTNLPNAVNYPNFVTCPNPAWLIIGNYNPGRLWRLPADGAGPLESLLDPNDLFKPDVSTAQMDSSGNFLVCSTEQGQLLRINVNDRSISVLAEHADLFRMQPNGDKILFTDYYCEGSGFISSLSSVNPPVQLELPAGVSAGAYITSPEFDRVAVDECNAVQGGIWYYGVSEFNISNLAAPAFVRRLDSYRLKYSPGGKWFAYQEYGSGIFSFEDRSGVLPPQSIDYGDQPVEFSPNDRWLIKRTGATGSAYVYTWDLLTQGSPPQLSMRFASAETPSVALQIVGFLADGDSYIASTNTGLYRGRAGTFGAMQLSGPASRARLSKDGSTVFFQALADFGERVYSVPTAGGPVRPLSGEFSQAPGTLYVYGSTGDRSAIYFQSDEDDLTIYAWVDGRIQEVAKPTSSPSSFNFAEEDSTFLFTVDETPHDTESEWSLYRSVRGGPAELVPITVQEHQYQTAPSGRGVYIVSLTRENVCDTCCDPAGGCYECCTFEPVWETFRYYDFATGEQRDLDTFSYSGWSSSNSSGALHFAAGPTPDDLLTSSGKDDPVVTLLTPYRARRWQGRFVGLSNDGEHLYLTVQKQGCAGIDCDAVITRARLDGRGVPDVIVGPMPGPLGGFSKLTGAQDTIAFTSRSSIFRMALNPPGDPVALNIPASNIAILPGGNAAIYTESLDSGVTVLREISLDGVWAPRTIFTPKLGTRIKYFAISPDTKNVLIEVDHYNPNTSPPWYIDLYSAPLDETRPAVALFEHDTEHILTKWTLSPEGRQVALHISAVPLINEVLYTVPVEGGTPMVRSHPAQFVSRDLVWTPEALYFSGSPAGDFQDRLYASEPGYVADEDLTFASADVNHDHRIDLSEALRVIQLYNAGAYHCDAATEDAYAPGAGDTACAPHTSDYAPQDWRIGLAEVLRAAQLYNARSYTPCLDGEDGFCPIY